MSAELVCGCGNRLRVSEAHVGRQVKCPVCGASMVAPASTGAPDRAAPAVARGGRSRAAAGLVALALLLIAGGLAGWWFFYRGTEPTGPDISDLSLIPANAQGF